MNGRKQLQTQIPREIREQESEIESILRNLVRSAERTCSRRVDDHRDHMCQQEVAAWIGISVLAFLSIIGCYLFWLKTDGDCTLHQVLRESATGAVEQIVGIYHSFCDQIIHR